MHSGVPTCWGTPQDQPLHTACRGPWGQAPSPRSLELDTSCIPTGTPSPRSWAPRHIPAPTAHGERLAAPAESLDSRGGWWFQSRGRVPTGPGLDRHALTLHARTDTRVHTRSHREAWSDTHTESRPASAALSAWGRSVPPPTAARQPDPGAGSCGGRTVPAAGAWPRGSRRLGASGCGAHRSAVVVPENLLVDVVEELLLQLQHNLQADVDVGAGAAGPRLEHSPRPSSGHTPTARGSLTFRSLSDSRNISFTTSFVSAARTVCIVAFVQRVWEGHRRDSVPGQGCITRVS